MSRCGIGRRIVAALAACVAVVAMSACSFSAPRKSVKKADVEKQIADQIAANAGERPSGVNCPGNLKAKEGTTMRCTLVASGGKYGVTVIVTSIKDNTVNFNIKVDDKPTP